MTFFAEFFDGSVVLQCTIRGTTLLMVSALSRHNPTTRLILRFCPSLVAYTPAHPPAALTSPLFSVSALVATAR